MILTRYLRTSAWLLSLGGLSAAAFFVEIEDGVRAPFEVRASTRAELRAPVEGFLREVYVDEGQRASPGTLLALLEVPDLTSKLAQKQAEVVEAQARLTLLRAGTRPEEVREQRGRVKRASGWRDLAERDLERARKVLEEELVRLDCEIAQYQAEQEYAEKVLERAKRLQGQQAAAAQEFQEAVKLMQVARAKQEQAKAQKHVRQALGTQQAEEELARREQELADAQAELRLLELGPRPEEVAAEQARLARLYEETRYLQSLLQKQQICTPVAGIVATPRLKEKVGQFLHEGDLICLVEESATPEVEIILDESAVGRVQPGQAVALKCRAFPLETIEARVERVAARADRPLPPSTTPSSTSAELPGTIVVYCRLEGENPGLLPGMAGYARIYLVRSPVSELIADRIWRYVQSEFWW